jgi:hypothetical protein
MPRLPLSRLVYRPSFRLLVLMSALLAGIVPARADLLSDSAYVESLYQKLLNRPSDPGGLAGWTGALTAHTLSRQDVASDFLYSAEYRSDFVRGLYTQYLRRAPDAGGYAGWVAYLTGGGTFEGAIAGFVGSPEYFQTQAGNDNGVFVQDLYHDLLGRAPDPGGYAGWLAAVNGGANRYSIASGFLTSGEYRTDLINRYTNLFTGGNATPAELTAYLGEFNAGFRDEVIIGQIAASETSSRSAAAAAVPEPGSLALFATSLGAICFFRRRRVSAGRR